MNFCSNCGFSQLKFEIPEGDNRPRYVCQTCEVIHYTNPKIVAGCLPIWKDKVLLAKRAIEPRRGYWNIPAGYLENKESVEEGALREVWEEAEARVNIEGVLAIYSIPRISQVYVLFRGQLITPDFGVGIESLDVQLFSEAEIPWSDIAFYSSKFALKRFFADRKRGTFTTHVGKM
ncbi:MAG: NUDIX hydrolase [Saprospiraceae bacterium]